MYLGQMHAHSASQRAPGATDCSVDGILTKSPYQNANGLPEPPLEEREAGR
jgi:hypothetical protein